MVIKAYVPTKQAIKPQIDSYEINVQPASLANNKSKPNITIIFTLSPLNVMKNMSLIKSYQLRLKLIDIQ
nr:MAG TPA: hypothetical protein [Caudoviricetes sp.]